VRECFFWYRLTWVVPDKGPENGSSSSIVSDLDDKTELNRKQNLLCDKINNDLCYFKNCDTFIALYQGWPKWTSTRKNNNTNTARVTKITDNNWDRLTDDVELLLKCGSRSATRHAQGIHRSALYEHAAKQICSSNLWCRIYDRSSRVQFTVGSSSVTTLGKLFTLLCLYH